MTEGTHDDLLQRALDGTLDERDATRLRQLLGNDAALRARAEQLRQLVTLIEDQETVQPPATFVNDVMERLPAAVPPRPGWVRRQATVAATLAHQLLARAPHHSGQGERNPESLWVTRWTGGGAIVAKRALWTVACLALAVIVGVVYYNGTRSVNGGAESTIGAADRYRGAQPTAADVKAEQAAAQQFLQTDLFDRMIKDKNVRSVLSDRDSCAVIARMAQAGGDAEAWAGVRNASKAFAQAPDEVFAALRNAKGRAAIADMQEAALLTHGSMRLFLGDGDALALLKKAQAAFRGDNEAFANALAGKQSAVRAVSGDADAALAALRKNAKFVAVMAEDRADMANLVKNANVMLAIDDPSFADLFKRDASIAWISDESVASLFKSHRKFMDNFDNAEFAGLVRNAKFMNALGANADFAEAMGLKNFTVALKEYNSLAAKLKNFSE